MPRLYKCTSKTFEAILGQKRGGGAGVLDFVLRRTFLFRQENEGDFVDEAGQCKMLHVSATFKRDYTLDLFFKIIIYNNLDYRRGGGVQSVFFVSYTCNILHSVHHTPVKKHHPYSRKPHFSLRKTHFFSAKITLFPLKNHKNITLDNCQRHTS